MITNIFPTDCILMIPGLLVKKYSFRSYKVQCILSCRYSDKLKKNSLRSLTSSNHKPNKLIRVEIPHTVESETPNHTKPL